PETRLTVGAMVGARAELYRLRRVVAQESLPAESAPAVAHGIIGGSLAMQRVIAVIDRVASRDVAVCIRGESGTGKERVARALHRASQRRTRPFVTVNCAALPEHLVESELFGHVRGAFTGADRDRIGLVAAADGGTLFLDEVGEMPLGAQAKLLRFLQDGELRRIGDVASRSADVRLLTATNAPLEAAVEEGRFREDLYYRIKVVEIVMPPLRERHGDVRLLAATFLAEEAARHRSGARRFAPEVLAVFDSYEWPGNVRELQNTIRAAHALAGEAREIDLEHLPERLRASLGNRTARGSYHDAVARFRRDLIEKSLLQTKGNQSRAAELLRISRQALAYQIRELGIMVEPGPRL
ncbi:MAG TPA: sigma 54-interacting transcriptional regulator, partial [Thermoanaerobaculia bacterium]|nr:sigma 54-interacting transcriptional regulator [Thermoanaerobaculia bacterium]